MKRFSTPVSRVLRPQPGEQAPAPGHRTYAFLGFVPLEKRTPAYTPGGYKGEPMMRAKRTANNLLPMLRRVREIMDERGW